MKPVLVIQLARFGDLLQTKRLVLSLLESGGPVHLLVEASLAPLARLVYPQVHVHGVNAHTPAEPSALLHTFQELAELDCQAVYNLNFSGLTLSLTTLFAPETVRGYHLEAGQMHMDPWAGLAFRWTARRRSSGINLADFWAGFARPMADPTLVNPVAQAKGGGLGVVLAGRMARRSLPPEVLARIIQVVMPCLSRPRIFLLGTAAERRAARVLKTLLPAQLLEKTTDLLGRTDWSGLVEALSGLDRLITPDTGVMHLAAHLGVPVSAFFLSSAWAHETGPYGLGHTVWQTSLECAPCLEAAECPKAVACLEPFQSRELLRLMGGKPQGQVPAGLIGYRTDLDALGVVNLPFVGEDPGLQARLRFRAFLARHLGLPAGQGEAPAPDLAENLVPDSQFMLDKPRTLPDALL